MFYIDFFIIYNSNTYAYIYMHNINEKHHILSKIWSCIFLQLFYWNFILTIKQEGQILRQRINKTPHLTAHRHRRWIICRNQWRYLHKTMVYFFNTFAMEIYPLNSWDETKAHFLFFYNLEFIIETGILCIANYNY